MPVKKKITNQHHILLKTLTGNLVLHFSCSREEADLSKTCISKKSDAKKTWIRLVKSGTRLWLLFLLNSLALLTFFEKDHTKMTLLMLQLSFALVSKTGRPEEVLSSQPKIRQPSENSIQNPV